MKAIAKLVTSVSVVAAILSCAAAPREAFADGSSSASVCAGISDADAASIKPNIESVQSKYETVSYPKGSPAQRLTGAVIYVRATQGTTAPWLTRVFSCGALAIQGARVDTVTTSTGFAVRIEGKDDATAREISKRSRELAGAQ